MALTCLPAWSALLPGAGSPGGTHVCAQTLCVCCLSVCLSAHPSSSCQPSAPAPQRPHPQGSEWVGWGAPPETALPAAKEVRGGLPISSGRPLSSGRLSECPDHQEQMAARGHVIKDQASLKTRPYRSLRPRLQRQRTCRPSSETPGHPVSGKEGDVVSAPTWAEPSPCRPGRAHPPGERPLPPCSLSAPLACHAVRISYVTALFLPIILLCINPSSVLKLTHCGYSDVNLPPHPSSS